jgi:hypothetical protein
MHPVMGDDEICRQKNHEYPRTAANPTTRNAIAA